MHCCRKRVFLCHCDAVQLHIRSDAFLRRVENARALDILLPSSTGALVVGNANSSSRFHSRDSMCRSLPAHLLKIFPLATFFWRTPSKRTDMGAFWLSIPKHKIFDNGSLALVRLVTKREIYSLQHSAWHVLNSIWDPMKLGRKVAHVVTVTQVEGRPLATSSSAMGERDKR